MPTEHIVRVERATGFDQRDLPDVAIAAIRVAADGTIDETAQGLLAPGGGLVWTSEGQIARTDQQAPPAAEEW